jgi:hypothetical protein
MYGLCKLANFFPEISSISSFEEKTLILPHSHFHIGSGIPQYLCLDMHQSLDDSKKSSNQSPANLGTQIIFLFSSKSH